MERLITILLAGALTILPVACSKKQIAPGVTAGVGAGLFAGGVGYRVSLPEEDSKGLFGDSPQQQAGTSILMFSGIALMLAGVIWSATTPLCEADGDCWAGDVCHKPTRTCVPAGPAVPGEP
jgi:hypothetical protein